MTEPRSPLRRIIGSAWFHLALALVVTGLVLTFVVKPYWVPSGSMQETLQPGDRMLVSRLAYVAADPAAGDIVVFDADSAWEGSPPPEEESFRRLARWIGEVTGFGPSSPHTLVKRVIGLPGQDVACCDAGGAVTVDGEPLVEDYIDNDFPFVPGELDCASEPRSMRCFPAVTVPEGSYLVLGDNRAGSSDSAARCRAQAESDGCWRWATRDGIVGAAWLRYWPLGSVSLL